MFDKQGRGIITWREFGDLLKALGHPDIPNSLLTRVSIPLSPAGLDFDTFLQLMRDVAWIESLDYTFNRHNAFYNIRVIRKSIALVVDGTVSVDDLRNLRMGFQLYEGESCSGIVLEEKQVLAAIRVMGKAIAPKKLAEWLNTFVEDVHGRIQLYEFLDLVKLCTNRDEASKGVNNVPYNIDRSRHGLFELTDQNFLLTPEQKLAKKMNDDYDTVLRILQAQQLIPKDNNHPAMQRVPSNPNRSFDDSFADIRDEIRASEINVQNARALANNSHSTATYVRPKTSLNIDSKIPPRYPNLSRARSVHSLRKPDAQDSFSDYESEKSEKDVSFYNDRYEDDLVTEDVISTADLEIKRRHVKDFDLLKSFVDDNGEASLVKLITNSINAPSATSSLPKTSLADLDKKRRGTTAATNASTTGGSSGLSKSKRGIQFDDSRKKHHNSDGGPKVTFG